MCVFLRDYLEKYYLEIAREARAKKKVGLFGNNIIWKSSWKYYFQITLFSNRYGKPYLEIILFGNKFGNYYLETV